jgi:hypothetical protein
MIKWEHQFAAKHSLIVFALQPLLVQRLCEAPAMQRDGSLKATISSEDLSGTQVNWLPRNSHREPGQQCSFTAAPTCTSRVLDPPTGPTDQPGAVETGSPVPHTPLQAAWGGALWGKVEQSWRRTRGPSSPACTWCRGPRRTSWGRGGPPAPHRSIHSCSLGEEATAR